MSTDKSAQPTSHRSVARSAGIISVATLCSRILGFARDIVIARLFGTYVYAQAFVVAFRIPNLFRDFVGEGASNAALVPVFSEYHLKHTKEEFWELANVVLNILLVVLSTITILGIIFSPVLVRLMAPGFISSPEKLEITIRLNRIIFPFVLLACLCAYSMGILNSLKHFAVPAFAPCLLNIAIIVCAGLFGEGITGLASGVLIGGVLQLAIQIPVLYKKGFRLHLFQRFRHPAAQTIFRLMIPRAASSCIYQLNNFVDTIFGSLSWIVGEGGVAVLYFSYRLILFPLGIFSTALSQAILPAFSEHALDSNHDRLKHGLSWGLRATFFAILPASAGFIVLARPIIATLFGGGKFDAASVQSTAGALLFYSVGLFAYAGTKILQSCFFALKDTRTPAKAAALSLVLNVIFIVVLMYPLKIGGIALATSISGIIAFLFLFFVLKKKIGDFGSAGIAVSFYRALGASACMGAVSFLVVQKSGGLAAGRLGEVINLSLSLGAGMVSYAAFCYIFRVREMHELWLWLTRRNK
ncbi:MAG: murein biosynthesis integral membrane protein MurJ [Candidatus Omnitrophota bacterium]|nr:murein biosynthesis integral membrane protein MurJ [Candidatus Omnitrophota bacterium]